MVTGTFFYLLSVSPPFSVTSPSSVRLAPPLSPAHRLTRTTYFNHTTRPHLNSAASGGRGGGGSQKWSRSNREWISSSVDFEEGEFFSRSDYVDGAAKQRVWWSNDGDDNENWDDDFGDNEFWGFKIIRAFGWMLPAVTVSYLLGTDNSNAFFMALAVPLGQTAISLIIDKVWASTTNGPKSRSRAKKKKKKKKPFAEAAGTAGSGERREESKTSGGRARSEGREESKTSGGRASYQSWVRDDGSYKNSNKRTQTFGGWDDLDKDSYKVPRGKPSEKEDLPPKQHSMGKLSRIRRVKEEPLLLRLLIAVFPFLGSWTRILF